MPDTASSRKVPDWLVPALWAALGCLLLALIGVAVFLLVVKMDFFSSKELTDEQAKAVWTFVGVSLGAVVTLIGTLLAEQHNRRTAALEREAEKRLTLDTVGKLLELLTENGEYARPARVGGAIATMVELEGGAVALRVLGDLWAARAVDTSTVVWLIERVLNEDRPDDEQVLAATLLTLNATALVPAQGDKEQAWYSWPTLPQPWPTGLPAGARDALLLLAPKVLLARERTYWDQWGNLSPVLMLTGALEDPDYRESAAAILAALIDCGALEASGVALDESSVEQLRELARGHSVTAPPFFTKLLSEFEPWAQGRAVHVGQTPPNVKP